MQKYFQFLLPAIVILISFPAIASAQASCGNIILIEDGVEFQEPIEDCANPFGATGEPSEPVIFEGTAIASGTDLTVAELEWGQFGITNLDSFFISIYKKEGDDYLYQNDIPDTGLDHYILKTLLEKEELEKKFYFDLKGESVNWSAVQRQDPFLVPGDKYLLVREFEQEYAPLSRLFEQGNYTLVLEEKDFGGPGGPSVSMNRNPILEFFIPTANAQFFNPAVYAVSFTVNGGDILPSPEPEIDPLILQYAPILYMHPDETYFPMNVEPFVEASALWSQAGIGDTLIRNANDLTFTEFESIIDSGVDTSDYYLAYSKPDESKTIDLANASTTYKNLVASDKATTTTYVRRMNDSYVDDQGVTQEFIVLQYWFFYAMNNWGEQGGFNDHEGDWESVFIYLDADTENPEYVAYSAHVNDGDPSNSWFQYDTVRRKWSSSAVTMDNGQLVSFISLGSHANYPNNGNNGIHDAVTANDLTSLAGDYLTDSDLVEFDNNNPTWIDYGGKWGSDGTNLTGNDDGPHGPRFNGISGFVRFEEPVAWAGIDKIIEVTTVSPTTMASFPAQGVDSVFANPIQVGTSFSVSPYYEPITFGIVPSSTTMLPNFWDIESSLASGTFSANISLTYDPTAVTAFGGSEDDIVAHLYNPSTDTWEPQATNVDIAQSTASFTTTHFSRYALGIVEPEPAPEELFEEFRLEVDDLNLPKKQDKTLLKGIDKIEKEFFKDDHEDDDEDDKDDDKKEKHKDKKKNDDDKDEKEGKGKKLDKSIKKLTKKIKSYTPKYLTQSGTDTLLSILDEIKFKINVQNDVLEVGIETEDNSEKNKDKEGD